MEFLTTMNDYNEYNKNLVETITGNLRCIKFDVSELYNTIQTMRKEYDTLQTKFDNLVDSALTAINADVNELSTYIDIRDLNDKGDLIRRIMNTFEIEYNDAEVLADSYIKYGLEWVGKSE